MRRGAVGLEVDEAGPVLDHVPLQADLGGWPWEPGTEGVLAEVGLDAVAAVFGARPCRASMRPGHAAPRLVPAR